MNLRHIATLECCENFSSEEVIAARNALTPEEQTRADDRTVKRFIRACNGNVAEVCISYSLSLPHTDSIPKLRPIIPFQSGARACSAVLTYARVNSQQASKRLANSLAWSLREQPERLVSCSTCTQEPSSHYMHVVGHDGLSRPVGTLPLYVRCKTVASLNA